ncbi:MAG: hypothetical protein PHU56_00280 [Candidatus Pacebacteria bacterium]|nr:hypothetical protein [Candidatus Paceibacterota bacterium]
MNPENFCLRPNPENPKEKTEQEKPLLEPRRLNYISSSLKLLKPERTEKENGQVEEERWQDLHERVGGFENSIDLSDQIRKIAVEWVGKKIPELKKEAPTLKNLPDEKLSFALANNWFSELPEVEGQRREVLLAVMASVAKRIEARMWYKTLERMDENDLNKMGIDSSERDLLADLLKTGSKANPLFVRFLAYSQLSPEASKKAGLQMFDVPGQKELFSLSRMFPKETGFLSAKFKKLFEDSKDKAWSNKPGGQEMARLLELMSKIYAKDTSAPEAQSLQEQIDQASDELIKSAFPIAIIPSMEGMYKEKHVDPEIKICVKSRDCLEQDKKFEKAKNVMADCLEKSGLKKFAESLSEKKTQSLIDIGEFGVNVAFKAVAQESKGTNVIFVNEQRRSYDANFSKYLDLISNAKEAFAGISEEQKQAMARMLSMFHEYSHLHPEESTGAKRLGEKAEAVICEAEADSVYRAFLPEIIEQGGIEGTKEQWACAMLASSLQELKDPESYAKSGAYTLKAALQEGAISWNANHLTINDYDKLFAIQRKSAQEILSLYKDTAMTESKANAWVNKNCLDKTVNEIIEFMAEQP